MIGHSWTSEWITLFIELGVRWSGVDENSLSLWSWAALLKKKKKRLGSSADKAI